MKRQLFLYIMLLIMSTQSIMAMYYPQPTMQNSPEQLNKNNSVQNKKLRGNAIGENENGGRVDKVYADNLCFDIIRAQHEFNDEKTSEKSPVRNNLAEYGEAPKNYLVWKKLTFKYDNFLHEFFFKTSKS